MYLMAKNKLPINSDKADNPSSARVIKTKSPATIPTETVNPCLNPSVAVLAVTAKTPGPGITANNISAKNNVIDEVNVMYFP